MSATPEHLIWRLHDFDNHQRAIQFVQQFQETLCVFSAPVAQLYTNYEINVPEDDHRSLVILPNPYAPHDTFNHVSDEAVEATGCTIVPGEMGNQEGGLCVTLALRRQGKRETRIVPLKVGLFTLMRAAQGEDPFLPVITKGDLRAFRKDTPSLHLHRIKPSMLTRNSPMEVKAMRTVILERLNKYMG